jgi:hypothetical protein
MKNEKWLKALKNNNAKIVWLKLVNELFISHFSFLISHLYYLPLWNKVT